MFAFLSQFCVFTEAAEEASLETPLKSTARWLVDDFGPLENPFSARIFNYGELNNWKLKLVVICISSAALVSSVEGVCVEYDHETCFVRRPTWGGECRQPVESCGSDVERELEVIENSASEAGDPSTR